MIASAGHALPGALSALRLRPMVERDLARATELELASYPADEAATPEGLQYRLRVAPELFYGVYEADALVGFIVSTTAPGDELEEETMSTHSPGGPSICIHSVVVAAKHRRRGIALAMVRAYVDAVVAEARCCAARRMVLLAKAGLLGLYRKAGFEVLGPSKVVHGADQWFDMGLDLTEKRKLDFMQVDAFTSVPLCGNPAAVLFTHRGGDEHWMQAVANENNLAETAFLERRDGGSEDSEWDIRWFTPVAEESRGAALLVSRPLDPDGLPRTDGHLRGPRAGRGVRKSAGFEEGRCACHCAGARHDPRLARGGKFCFICGHRAGLGCHRASSALGPRPHCHLCRRRV